MFIETRTVGNSKKYYLIHTYRDEDKVKRISFFLGSNLNNQELNNAEKTAKDILLKKVEQLKPNNFYYKDDKDSWMLGENIPDVDLFFSQIWLHCFVRTFHKQAGRAYNKILAVYRGKNLLFYYGEKDSYEVGENILQEFLKNPERTKEVNKNIIIQSDKLRKFCATIAEEKVQNLSNHALWDIYQKHNELHTEYYTWGWIPVAVDMFHGNLTNKLMEYLEKKAPKEKCSQCFSILTQPIRRSLIQEQERDLLRIAKYILSKPKQKELFKELYETFEEQIASQQRLAQHSPEYEEALLKKVMELEKTIDKDIKEMLHAYYEKYFYVKFMWVGKEDTYTLHDFLSKLVKIIGRNANVNKLLKEMDAQLEKNKKKAEKLKKELKIEKQWATLFDAFGEFMVTKIYRRYAQIYAVYKMHAVLEEIAKSIGMTKDDVEFMLPQEVMSALLEKKIEKETIKKRTEFCVYYLDKTTERVLVGRQALRLAKLVERKKIQGVTELKGQTGCIGIGKGHVKLIFRPSDMSKMNYGDVLVSIATDPDIVPAMKKASAIVTEQGGVTSHAAIVARELGIPCVIGTKIATQVLQDDDIVEVDATKAVVTVVSRNQKKKEQHAEVKEETKEMNKEEMKTMKESQPAPALFNQEYILWFKEVSKKDIPLVGGKGSSLGEMHSIMPVPEGFCITVKAYQEVLKEDYAKFMLLLEQKNKENIEELEAVANIIKSKIMNSEIPREIENTIKENYSRLGGKVAVRSSATTEDLEEASFAGQQDTFLNVEGEENVLAAVKKCWASLFNPRAIYYREKNNFRHDHAFLSVVIQKMVNAEKAGVMFTVNPINKVKDEMIIEACFGLGEKLVSGEITPDTFIVTKNKEIKEKHLNFETQTLSEKELYDLIEFGKKIESHYNKPMDIEWAIEKGKIFILQARPITTIK